MAAPIMTAPTVQPPVALTTKPELAGLEVAVGEALAEAPVDLAPVEAAEPMEVAIDDIDEAMDDMEEAWLELTVASTAAVSTALVEETATVLWPFSTTKKLAATTEPRPEVPKYCAAE
jgi:hypothetical protein